MKVFLNIVHVPERAKKHPDLIKIVTEEFPSKDAAFKSAKERFDTVVDANEGDIAETRWTGQNASLSGQNYLNSDNGGVVTFINGDKTFFKVCAEYYDDGTKKNESTEKHDVITSYYELLDFIRHSSPAENATAISMFEGLNVQMSGDEILAVYSKVIDDFHCDWVCRMDGAYEPLGEGKIEFETKLFSDNEPVFFLHPEMYKGDAAYILRALNSHDPFLVRVSNVESIKIVNTNGTKKNHVCATRLPFIDGKEAR